MKKLCVWMLIIFMFCTSFVGLGGLYFNHANADVLQVKILYNQANIYNRQDFLEISYNERQNAIIKVAKINEVYTVLQTFDKVYKIEVEDGEGYILKSMAVDKNLVSPTKKIEFNATIISDDYLYQKPDENSEKIQILKDTKVCVTGGYDAKQEYTLICYYDNDTLVNGYVKTEILKVSGVNAMIFIYLSVIIAAVTIIVIIAKLFIGKKKKTT